MKLTYLALLISTFSFAQDFNTVVTAFSQKDKGNCASIAVIKAAIIKYGIGNVFSETEQDSGMVKVTLKNCTEFLIKNIQLDKYSGDGSFFQQPRYATKNELKTETDSLRKADKAITNYASRCFAVMVANYAREKGKTGDDAIRNLNHGFNPLVASQYLGIDALCIILLENSKKGTMRLKQFEEEGLYVFYNSRHAAVASKNQYDEYSSLVILTRFQKNHHTIFKWGRRFWAYGFK